MDVSILGAVSGDVLARISLPRSACVQHVKHEVQAVLGINIFRQRILHVDILGDHIPLARLSEPIVLFLVCLPLEEGQEVAAQLLAAAESGNADVVLQLLELPVRPGVTVLSQDRYCETSLSAASRNGHAQVVRLLCEAWVDLNDTDDNGVTPLGMAAFYGNIEVVRVLIGSSADVDKGVASPMIMASKGGHAEVVRLLCETGADTNKVSGDDRRSCSMSGVSAHSASLGDLSQRPPLEQIDECARKRPRTGDLMCACSSFDLDSGRELSEIRPSKRSADWAFAVPFQKRFRETLGLQKLEGVKRGSFDLDDTRVGAEETLRAVRRRTLETDSCGSERNVCKRPLHADGGSLPASRKKACRGHCGLRGADHAGWVAVGLPPLRFAAERGHAEVVSVLMAFGADVEFEALDGSTSLDAAVCMGHSDVVRILMG